jgi:hypothetical protein
VLLFQAGRDFADAIVGAAIFFKHKSSKSTLSIWHCLQTTH